MFNEWLQNLSISAGLTGGCFSSQSSQCSRGAVLKLEQLVEALQDRRRTADQAARVKLQQAENGIMVHEEEPESRPAGSEVRH